MGDLVSGLTVESVKAHMTSNAPFVCYSGV